MFSEEICEYYALKNLLFQPKNVSGTLPQAWKYTPID
jgi:hypothetical protein